MGDVAERLGPDYRYFDRTKELNGFLFLGYEFDFPETCIKVEVKTRNLHAQM